MEGVLAKLGDADSVVISLWSLYFGNRKLRSSKTFKKLAEGDGTKDGNMAFSPLSIYTALGLVAAGARGKTLDDRAPCAARRRFARRDRRVGAPPGGAM
jgi:hypothetical protein